MPLKQVKQWKEKEKKKENPKPNSIPYVDSVPPVKKSGKTWHNIYRQFKEIQIFTART